MKNHISLPYNQLFNRICNHTILTILLLSVHAQSFAAAAPAEDPYTLTPLQVAIIQGNSPRVRNIIEQEPTALAQKDCHGWTPLHFAAQHGHQAIAQYLIEKDQTLLTQKDNEGWTPLHIATANEHLSIVQCILQVDPITLNQKTNDGSTPFYLTQTNKKQDIIRYIYKIAHEYMPLHTAARKGQLDRVQQIVEKDPTTLTQTNFLDATPLYVAILTKHLDIVRYFIEKNRSLINQRHFGGTTALHTAAEEGCLSIAQYIIEKDPTSIAQKNNAGQLPHHLAARKGHLDIIKAILQADKSLNFFRAKTSNGGNMVLMIPSDKEAELITLLKTHLLGLHQADPDGQHIQCPICLEAATECPDCKKTIADPLARMRITPCCLKILCEHDFLLNLKSGNLICPYCRGAWEISIAPSILNQEA